MPTLVENKKVNKTHSAVYSSVDEALKHLKYIIMRRGDLPHCNVKDQLIILEELSSFELGKHILMTGGANGVWTDYMISPKDYLGPKKLDEEGYISRIEKFLLFGSPVVLAQRELFYLSQKIAKNLLKTKSKLASIPCGVMRDLLSLNLSSMRDVSLVGVDIDPAALNQAKLLASALNLENVTFFKRDAWNLGFESSFDFISSIGLNVYEPNKKRVIDLYKCFHKSLKPGGVLFTGVLTWPPYIDKNKTEWVLEKIPKEDLYLEQVIHKDILNIKWLNFKELDKIELDFKKAGFSYVEIHPDTRCVFPAVVARK